MSAVSETLKNGFACLVYGNALNSTTIVLFDAEDWEAAQKIVNRVPDERVIDIMGEPTAERIETGVATIGRKMRREGEYKNWDEKMAAFGLPNPSDRPQIE